MQRAVARSDTLRLRVWGENACFTRPEMKVERVSYEVMTPSAARGILEAIHWKPAISWVVEQIDVLKPIRWESVRRNEVGGVMSPRAPGLFIEDQRQQRAGLFLRDVDYVIHAHFEMTGRIGPEDTVGKHSEMFLRRAGRGQCFHRAYLGCREFAANFSPIPAGEPSPKPIEELPELGFGTVRELGYTLHDYLHCADSGGAPHFCSDQCRPTFFKAVLANGQLKVPPLSTVGARR